MITLRQAETKLGQCISLLPKFDLAHLKQAKKQGCQFAILGIAEDLGPRANHGKGGADQGFIDVIKTFANLQSNQFFTGLSCLLIGQIELTNDQDDTSFTEAINVLDTCVTDIISTILKAQLTPIVIGGGHNNSFGLLQASYLQLGAPLAAVNLDPHADFRPCDNRHSGNGFSYAAQTGALAHYQIIGLHEQKNTEASLVKLNKFGALWYSYEDIWIREKISLTQVLKNVSKELEHLKLPLGLELDLDAIANMPSSAMNMLGVSLSEACQYINHMASNHACYYLHLAEAAPRCHDSNLNAGLRVTSQAISELMLTFMKASKAETK